MPQKLTNIVEFLREFAPLELAEDWDNVGLLVGDEDASVRRVMTCLTLTPDVAAEAIEKEAELIVTHHPIMFRPLKKLTSKSSEGKMLLDLIAGGVAVYSPHTAFDSASLGINQRLANDLGLTSVAPIRLNEDDRLSADSGSGRYGKLKQTMTLGKFLDRVKTVLNVPHLQYVGDLDCKISKVGVACGSAAEFLRDAQQLGCDVLLTGEARFHACLEARTLETSMILAGHFATERPAVEELAKVISSALTGLKTWASETETDPLEWSVS